MIVWGHDLPLAVQARQLGIARGSIYHLPRPGSDADLKLMRRIDDLHLAYPFAGSRTLCDLLCLASVRVGRRHVTTLMMRMEPEALYRRPNTSKRTAGHEGLSVSAARAGDHAARSGLGN